MPYRMTKQSPEFGHLITGSCFDSQARKLYLYQSGAHPESGACPMVHVYHVKEGGKNAGR